MLEDALVASGAMRPSNAGAPHKVAWSRSSRTDAGVHSVATVAGLRLELEPAYAATAAAADPEGVALAGAINAHLPPAIRVFSAHRVPGGWDARAMCGRRDYRYYLPASMLGAEPGTAAGDAALAAFRETLAAFVGTHAFHNFTVRRAYRPDAKEGAANRRAGPGRRRELPVASEDEDGEGEEEGDGEGHGHADEPDHTNGHGAGAGACAGDCDGHGARAGKDKGKGKEKGKGKKGKGKEKGKGKRSV